MYSQPKRSRRTVFLTSAFEMSVWVIVANRLSLIGWWVCFFFSVTGTICRCPEITRKTNLQCLITALMGVTDSPRVWMEIKKRPEKISAGSSCFFPCYHALISPEIHTSSCFVLDLISINMVNCFNFRPLNHATSAMHLQSCDSNILARARESIVLLITDHCP